MPLIISKQQNIPKPHSLIHETCELRQAFFWELNSIRFIQSENHQGGE